MFRIWPVTKAQWVGPRPHPTPHKPKQPRETHMHKLIDAYKADPTIKNALRLKRHADVHPMAACMLGVEDTVLLRKAIKQLDDNIAGG